MALCTCSSSESSQSYRLPGRRVQTKHHWQPVGSDGSTDDLVHVPSGRHVHPQHESRRFIPTRSQVGSGFFEEIPLRLFDAPAQVHLLTEQLRQAIHNKEGDGSPVSFGNHAKNSAIAEIALTGLCQGRRHVGIVEFQISSNIPVSPPQYVIARQCGVGSDHEVAGSVISFCDGLVRTTLAGVMSLQEIFYCRDTYIRLEVELFSQGLDSTSATEDEYSGPHFYLPVDYTSHSEILVPCSWFPVLSPHPDYVLNGHPSHFEAENISVMEASLTEKMADVLDDDRNCTTSDPNHKSKLAK